MTEEEAIAKCKSEWWYHCSAAKIVEFQLFEDRLCMDFSAFHGAVESVLGRQVFTHEFRNMDALRAEYNAKVGASS